MAGGTASSSASFVLLCALADRYVAACGRRVDLATNGA
jgi:hypothetical protein